MKRIVFKQEDLSNLPLPEVGYLTMGVSENGEVSKIDETGVISTLGGGDFIPKSTGTTYNANNVSVLTQAEYDALTPDAETIYFIV